LIDFYNIQYYNQGTSQYLTYETLFQKSDGWATGTAVLEIAQSGVDLKKIVIGKPVTTADVTNTGYVQVDTLAQYLSQAVSQTPWMSGVTGWQFSSDKDGTWSSKLAKSITKKYEEISSSSSPLTSSTTSTSTQPTTVSKASNFHFMVVNQEEVCPSKFWWVDDEGDVCVIENAQTLKESLRIIAKTPLTCSALFFLNENNARKAMK